MARVSVIIPTYNRTEFLRSAIQSVINQTFQDFEIMVVDDASGNNNAELVSSFNDKRIKHIRHVVNKGVSATRNTGIRASSSDYIAFLDDDDEWLPEKLRKQVNLLESSSPKVGGVYTGYLIVARNSGEILSQRIPTERGYIFDKMLTGNCIGNTSITLFRKECFEKVGLFDGESIPFEDFDLWLRISKEFYFDCIKEPLARYYIHDKDRLSTNAEASVKGIETILKKYGRPYTLRKYFSYRYLSLGITCCYNENTKKGREAFLRAIRLYPFEIRHYFNLFLCLFGADNFIKWKGLKKHMVESFWGIIKLQ